MAQETDWVRHLLTLREQGLQHNSPPEPGPIYTLDQKAYNCYWQKGTTLYAGAGVHVHLSFPWRLSV